MKKKIFCTLFITIIPLLSLYSSRINYESEKAEVHLSAFSLFIIQKDSTLNNYNVALNLYKAKEYTKALKLSFKLLDEYKDENEIVLINNLIGDVFKETNNHSRAIKHYLKSLNILNKIKIKSNDNIKTDYSKLISSIYIKLAPEYQLLKDAKIDSALYYYDKLLKHNSIDKKSSLLKARAYNNLSAIYRDIDTLKDLSKAKLFINKAIDINKIFGENIVLASNYSNLANVYMEEKNFNKAKSLYFKAIRLLEKDNREEAIKYKEVLYDNLGWTLYNMKNYIAYEYLDKSVAIRDSLNNIELRKAIKEIETRNNVDLATKDAEAKTLLAQKNALEAKEDTWLVGGIGVGTALLLLVLVNYYKLRQRNLSLKLSENELVQQKNIEKIKTEAQTKILNATLDGKEVERKLIAETLHDNVSAMLSSANLHLEASQKQFNGNVPLELKKTQEIIKEASLQIRDLSHNLVSSILLKFGLEYAVNDIAEKYSNSMLKIHVDIENIKRYNQGSEIKIYNIIQELINNIIKHSKARNTFIKLFEENNNLYFSIEDDGVGFDKNTAAIKNSVGLNQIDARIKMLKGTFFINSNKETGTEVNISIPINAIREINNA